MKYQQEIKLLNKIKELNGKVKYIYENDCTTAILKIDGKYNIGYSICNELDQFSKKKGRVISLGRAFKMYENKKFISKENLSTDILFKEDRNVA
jgi:hypothetical protein